MANHGYITRAREWFKFEYVDLALRDINQTFFKGLINIRPWSDKGGWDISYASGDTLYFNFPIWLATRRKIEIRHQHLGTFAWWIDSTITNELARRFDGTISDDGVERKWKYEPNHPRTLLEFIEDYHKELPFVVRKVALANDKRRVPKEFL